MQPRPFSFLVVPVSGLFTKAFVTTKVPFFLLSSQKWLFSFLTLICLPIGLVKPLDELAQSVSSFYDTAARPGSEHSEQGKKFTRGVSSLARLIEDFEVRACRS